MTSFIAALAAERDAFIASGEKPKRQININPRTEALAARIWAHCEPIGWNCRLKDCAFALGVSVDRVRGVAQVKGWLSRFRAARGDGFGGTDGVGFASMPLHLSSPTDRATYGW